MKRTTLYAIIAVAVIIAGLVVAGLRYGADQEIARISDFEDCIQAGFPVLDTFPEQCMTPDGRVFAKLVTASASSSLTATATPPQALDDIRIVAPASGELLVSPLAVAGTVQGSWFNEAEFPVTLLDGEGNIVANGSARAQGDWNTEDFVPFLVQLTFSQPQTATGTLVFRNSNPSGLPEHAEEVRVPVTFGTSTPADFGTATPSQNEGTSTEALCRPTGCSGEICSDTSEVSSCIYKPMYACYKEPFAQCERQANGACGWSENSELAACLQAGGPGQ